MTLGELQQRVQALLPDATSASRSSSSSRRRCVRPRCRARGRARAIDVMPVFWANGGHMANDVPPLLAELRRRHPGLQLRLLPVLSELPGMLDFIARAVARGGD